MATNNAINAPKPFAVGIGGTGNATLTNHGVMLGQGASNVALSGPNASTHAVFMSTGSAADPNFTTTGTPYFSGLSFDSGTNTMANYSVNSTWTPDLKFGGANTGITYSPAPVGLYSRIGKIVLFFFKFGLTSKGTATGNATVTGFPFTSLNIGANVAYSPFTTGGINFPAGGTVGSLVITPNSNILFLNFSTNNSIAAGNLFDTNFTNTSQCFCSAWVVVQ